MLPATASFCSWGNWVYAIFGTAIVIFIILIATKVIGWLIFIGFIIGIVLLLALLFKCYRPTKSNNHDTSRQPSQPIHPNYNTNDGEIANLLQPATPYRANI